MGRGMPPDMFGQFPRPGETHVNFITRIILVYYCKCCSLIVTLLVIYSSIDSEYQNNPFPGAFIFQNWLAAHVFQCFCAIFYV